MNVITYHCHTAIEKVLSKSLLTLSGMSFPGQDTFVLSTFLPQFCTNPNCGIEESVRIRLGNQHSWIIILSFLDKEYLTHFDSYNLLSLNGTVFIRLPIENNHLLSVLQTCNNTPISLSDEERQIFIDNVCVSEIKKIFLSLKHGGKLDLGNTILNPLRIACKALLDFPAQSQAMEGIIENHFKELEFYLQLPEIQELQEWLNIARNTSDKYLATVQKFILKLSLLKSGGTVLTVLFNIEKINNLLDQIITDY